MDSDTGHVFTTNLRGPGSVFGESAQSRNVESGIAGSQVANVANVTDESDIRDSFPIAEEFARFLEQFTAGTAVGEYFYIKILQSNLKAGLHFIEIDMAHLELFSMGLAMSVKNTPTHALPQLEGAVERTATRLNLWPALPPEVRQLVQLQQGNDAVDPLAEPEGLATASGAGIAAVRPRQIQVQIFWGTPDPVRIRQLAHEQVARLIAVSGIVVRAAATASRCTRAVIQCTSCRHKMAVPGARTGDLPAQCQEGGGSGGQAGSRKCRPSPYVLLPDESAYEDQQSVRLQEPPEDVPTGELPRHVTVVLDRYLADKVAPGARIQVAAVVSVQDKRTGDRGGSGKKVAGLRSQFLRAVGLMLAHPAAGLLSSVNENYSSTFRSRSSGLWQPEDEALFKSFAREGSVYDSIASSIDPAVFGLEDQKRAIACLLFGGTRKQLHSGGFLRGDMNVLFIGDPSTAKSQLLKFTERVAPIGIYTSGKGSSAAGLTASVVGGGGEFWLEAGTMVLADGGVACIDEFDKMREQDQVAIHEAMEQQTISIAKASLTTMLNSRTSVLAAANPTLGAYDPLRSNEEQMDFQGSILTRFDLIFKVLDLRDPNIDTRLAAHVVRLHQQFSASRADAARAGRAVAGGGGMAASGGGGGHGVVQVALDHSGTAVSAAVASGRTGKSGTDDQSDGRSGYRDMNGNIKVQFLMKYIAYAKATCRPRIGLDAAKALEDFYVRVRKQSHEANLASAAAAGVGSGSRFGSGSGGDSPAIQITARQLESLVRITEALAKMRLAERATVNDAEEAIRLFCKSTVDAIATGVVESNLSEAQSELVLKMEDTVRRRVPVGASVRHAALMLDLKRMSFDTRFVDRAVAVMVRRGELEWRAQRTMLYRKM